MVNPREARAQELEAIGRHRTARRLRACGQPVTTKVQHKLILAPCRRRECPRCAREVIAKGYRRTVGSALVRMKRPYSVRFAVASMGEWDLKETLQLLRERLARLRRLASMRGVTMGVGMIHPQHGRGARWNLHAHLFIDVPDTFEIARVEKDWKRLTSHRGHVEPRPPVDADGPPGTVGSIDTASAYVTKADDWCPQYGSLGLDEYDVLCDAIEGRQLVIRWGIGARGRRSHALRAEKSGNVTSVIEAGPDSANVASEPGFRWRVQLGAPRGRTEIWRLDRSRSV